MSKALHCLTFAVVLLAPQISLNAQVLDQSISAQFPGNPLVSVSGKIHRAQTFTVGVTGILDSVAVKGIPQQGLESVIVEIRSTVGGVPVADDNNPLAATTVLANTFSLNSFARIDLSSSQLIVTEGEVLALSFRYSGSEMGDILAVVTRTSDVYPSGASFVRDTSGGQDWFLDGTRDLGLQTRVLPFAENDDCSDAIALPSSFADTPYIARGATTDGMDATGFCDYGDFGDEQNDNDIWFTYTPDVGGCTYISTLNLAGYDTRLTIYDSTGCPDDPANIIACVDEEHGPLGTFPFEAGLDVDLQSGVTYLIRLGTFNQSVIPEEGTLRIAQGPGAQNITGPNPGAPGCEPFPSFCNGDGGDQLGCTDCPCNNNATPGTIGGCAHSASALYGGAGSRLFAEGDPSVSLPPSSITDLKFSMENLPPMSTSVLFSGANLAPTNMANPCFGYGVAVPLGASGEKDGLRCAVGGLLRHGNRQSDSNGEIKDDLGSSRTWGGVAGPIEGIAAQASFVAGQTRYFQATHRDLASEVCGTGLNTSQAIRVTFTP